MNLRKNLFCAVICCSSSAAFANPPDFPSFSNDSNFSSTYIGATFSRLTLDSDIDFNGSDNNQNAFKLFSGIRFNPYIAVEAGAISIDEFKLINHYYKSDSTGLFSRALIGAPLAENLYVYGTIGASGWLKKDKTYFNNDDYNNDRYGYDDEDDEWLTEFINDNTSVSFTYGLGGEYRFGTIAVRAEYERFRKDSLDHNLFNLGLVYHF